MSFPKSVTIIGGGLAGLSAAVFLIEKNFKVTLIEASPKLGGRAYSFFDSEKNLFFDNGQHILAGWYKNTFEYLKIIGSLNKLEIQKSLEVNFIDTEKKVYKLKCPNVPAPINLLLGLLRFNALSLKDKISLINIRKFFKGEEESDTNCGNVKEFLRLNKQTENLIRFFWEPFVLAVFNNRLENVGTKIFLNVLRTGFEKRGDSSLVIPNVNLNELFIDGAVEYFKRKHARMLTNKRVTQILIDERVKEVILEDGNKIYSDYYVSAVPFFTFGKLFEERIYSENNFKAQYLRPSAIISVHMFFENIIPQNLIPNNSFGMTGLIGTTVQWIFKRSNNHLSLVISGADLELNSWDNEMIFNLCKDDLNKTIREFQGLKIKGYKIIREKRATFIPDAESSQYRPGQKTKYENLFIAGDWTDTGLPATIESAIKSAKTVVEEIAVQ